ncbi:MAG: amidohydrolase [Paludibacteraceae bacterium]|nr:amidohydrolase [Paludibacteraceae bacterium]
MKKISVLLLLPILLLASCSRPKTLLLLGNVITMDSLAPTAEAVFVENGIITYVGSVEAARALCNKNTVVKDYGTASIYPGFLEGHTHGLLAADRFLQADLTEVNRQDDAVMDDFVQAMKQYMEENPGLPMYKGAGWTPKDREPNAAMLDAICPDVPMFLNTEDGHSMWLNTAAMEQFGIDKEAVKKYGSDCVRMDAEGNPTGYLSENPAIEILGKISMTKEECKQGLLQWQELAFSYGFTAVTEAGLGLGCPYGMEAYQELCDEGLWKLRTYANLVIDENVPDDKLDSALSNVLAMHNKHNGEYFKVIGTKMFIDGVIEAHTGWLKEEYTDQPGYYGLKRCPESSRVAKIVAFNNKNGMNVHFHSIGDAATHIIVEGVAQAVAETGIREGRNAVSHLQVVDTADYQAFANNNLIAVVAPIWSFKEPIGYDYTVQYIGLDRAENQYPIRSFYDLGCKVNFHSDYPISPSMSVAWSVYMATTRTIPDLGSSGVLNPSECINREQALRAMTTDCAYQWREEERQGSIVAGKLANFAIWDRDFLHDGMDTIWDATVLATYVDGQVVYGE